MSKIMKKIIISVLLITITFTIAQVIGKGNEKNGMTCMYPVKYDSTQELKESDIVDVILLGKVIKTAPYKDYTTGNLGYLITTNYTIAIEQSIKGNVRNTVQVHQDGGRLGDKVLRKPDEPMMKIGDIVVLFLHEFSDGNYYIVGGPQGKYIVDNNHVFNSAEISKYKDVQRYGENLKTHGMKLETFLNQLG